MCAPDDGWKYHPKHVEQLPDINKLCDVASLLDIYWNILTMHGPINVKSPNNTSKWQMGFNSAFKGLSSQSYKIPRKRHSARTHVQCLSVTNHLLHVDSKQRTAR